MKIVRIILICLAIIIAIPLLIALFVHKEYAVEREVTINRPKQEVYDYVKYLRNQNNYSKWANMDPNMKKEFSGTDGTIGFVSAWDSDKKDVGSGEQEIKNIHEGDRIDYEIRFKKPFASVASSYMQTQSEGGNQTKVKWGFNGHMPYPMNIMLVFMDMNKMIGNDLQTGLDNLKTIMEKK
jgi:hypothetical protein